MYIYYINKKNIYSKWTNSQLKLKMENFTFLCRFYLRVKLLQQTNNNNKKYLYWIISNTKRNLLPIYSTLLSFQQILFEFISESFYFFFVGSLPILTPIWIGSRLFKKHYSSHWAEEHHSQFVYFHNDSHFKLKNNIKPLTLYPSNYLGITELRQKSQSLSPVPQSYCQCFIHLPIWFDIKICQISKVRMSLI